MGLKIHTSKSHKYSCDACDEYFAKEELDRHVRSDRILGNICETKSDQFDLELSRNRKDEPCLGIFSLRQGRDDSLPLLYLHTSECWHRSGHMCPELPENNLEEDNEGLAINYDIYDPTLHTRLDDHVVGDLN